jgi:digeranylgeranylglycerophospholipid reductase
MNEKQYDVVIIGGGPAGTTTAKYAAKKGISVLIVEKRQEIGAPVRCGEGISKKWLSEVGIKEDPRWIANKVDGARIFSPSGYCLEIGEEVAGNEVGYVIERDIFDKTLATDAVKAGAEIMLKTSAIDVLKKNGRICGIKARCFDTTLNINAKITVAADGFESQVARWAGIDTSLKPADIISCFEYRLTNIECNPRYCDFYLGSCAPGAYAWVFPKSETTANVGIGIMLSKIKSTEYGCAKKKLDAFIASKEHLKNGKPLDMIAGAVSVSKPIEQTVSDGLLIVGDAARQIDPLTGGGIANACISARIAGEVIAESIEANDVSANFLKKYDIQWRRKLEEKLYRNWFAKEKLADLDDALLDKIIKTLADANIKELSVYSILKVVQQKLPELVKELEMFL